MGAGRWAADDFVKYSRSVGRTVGSDGSVAGNYTAQEIFRKKQLAQILNPRGVIRECCDTPEHPNTIPVILALDVTGSMGTSAVEIAKKLNVIMTELYTMVEDVEFMVMGIGDVMYDKAPIQASQFESDIRIAEQLDQMYFEGGGGGNTFESYTGAWYFGARHTRLDCWKRGKKGVIITIGDEPINPYIPIQGRCVNFASYMGDALQSNIETKDLLMEVTEKYDLYHLVVDHGGTSSRRVDDNVRSFRKYLPKKQIEVVTVETLAETVVKIVTNHSGIPAVKEERTEQKNEEKKGIFAGLLNLATW